jgi:hypothetical protein
VVDVYLSGGVEDKDFRILKFTIIDRGHTINQYVPMYKEQQLIEGNPINNIKEAKSVIKEWYQRKISYLKMLKQGHKMQGVYDMLAEKGIVD